MLYTGHVVALFTWLLEFIGKRLREGRLRESLPGLKHDKGSHDTGAKTRGQVPSEGSGRGGSVFSKENRERRDTLLRHNSAVLSKFPTSTSPKDGTRLTNQESPRFPETPEKEFSPKEGVTTPGTSGDIETIPEKNQLNKIKLNVPVLAAGVRVMLRKVGQKKGTDTAAKPDSSQSKQSRQKESDKTPGFALRFATWQLVKGFSQFLEATATDFKVDARAISGGIVTANHVAVTSRIRPTAMLLSVAADVVRVTDEDETSEVNNGVKKTSSASSRLTIDVGDDSNKSELGHLLDSRIDVTLRYNLREGRVLVAQAEFDVGELSYVDTGEGSNEGLDEEGMESTTRSSTASNATPGTLVSSALRCLPSVCTVKVRHTRLRTLGAMCKQSGGDDAICLSVDAFSFTAERRTDRRKGASGSGKSQKIPDPRLKVSDPDNSDTSVWFETKWSGFGAKVCHEDNLYGQLPSPITQKTRASIFSTAGGSVVSTVPLTDCAHERDSEPKPNLVRVRMDLASVGVNVHPRVVNALERFAARTASRKRKPKTENETHGSKTKPSPEFTFETECRVFDGCRVEVYDQGKTGMGIDPVCLVNTAANVVEFRVNAVDDLSLENSENSERGVVVVAQDWRWRVANDSNDSKNNFLTSPCHAARVEMRAFGGKRDIEVSCARVDVGCEEFVELDRNFARAVNVVGSSGKRLRAASTGKTGATTTNDSKPNDAHPQSTSTSTRVLFVDGRVRCRKDMSPDSRNGVDPPVTSTSTTCAFETVANELALEWNVDSDKGSKTFSATTSGLGVTYRDDVGEAVTVCEDFHIADDGEKIENENIENLDQVVRLAKIDSARFEEVKSANRTTNKLVTGAGIDLCYDPDALFGVVEVLKNVNGVRGARYERRKDGTLEKQKSTSSQLVSTTMSVDVKNVSVEARVTDGAEVAMAMDVVKSKDVTKGVSFIKPSAKVNGYFVATSLALDVVMREKIPDGVQKCFATEEVDAKRRRLDVTTTSPRLSLPHGLDIGDFTLALDVGIAGIRSFFEKTGTSGENDSRTNSTTHSSSPKQKPRVTELFVRVVGSLECAVFDTPLQRMLRVKSAVLEPIFAAARALDASEQYNVSKRKKRNTQEEYLERVKTYTEAVRFASSISSGAQFADDTNDGQSNQIGIHKIVKDAVVAGRFVMGHDSSVLCVFGGDPTSAEASTISLAKKVDAPFSDKINLKPTRSGFVDVTFFDFEVQLPMAPGPLFFSKAVKVTGPVVQARQVALGVTDGDGLPNNSLANNACTPSLLVGRRRAVAAKPPDAPKRPPIKTYTDFSVKLSNPGGCFSVGCEPSLVGFIREMNRVAPPPGLRHKHAPGGGGGRDAYAAKVAKAWRSACQEGWRDKNYTLTPPVLPAWDIVRAIWRGNTSVVCSDLAYVFDSRTDTSLGARSKGPVGLEVGAKKATLEIISGSVGVKVARLSFAARGGVGGVDDEFYSDIDESSSQLNVDDSLNYNSPYDSGAVQLAVVPAAEFTVHHEWRTLGSSTSALHESGQDHHRFDERTASIELFPVRSHFSTELDIALEATLTTKDTLVKAWREAESVTKAEGKSPYTSSAAKSPRSFSSLSPLSAAKTQVEQGQGQSTPKSSSPLARWMSGDFGPGPRVSLNRASPKGLPPKSPKSPSSPGLASAVSAAAAASVADSSTTPTLILGPSAIRWCRGFIQDLTKPSGGFRKAWRTPVRGIDPVYKRPRHPLVKPLPRLIRSVNVTLSADSVRLAHPAESPTDTARGLTAHTSGAKGTFSFQRQTVDSAVDPIEPIDQLNPTSRVSFEVTLREIKVLLPPRDISSETPTTATPGTPKFTRQFAYNQSPTGYGGGNFDEVVSRYEAVVEMLKGTGGGGGGGLESGTNKNNKRDTTDPALVLETKSARFVKSADTDTPGTPNQSSYTKISLESPRFLKAAARKDASVRWARDALRAATAPATPRHTISALRRMEKRDKLDDETTETTYATSIAPPVGTTPFGTKLRCASATDRRARSKMESWDGSPDVPNQRTKNTTPLQGGDDLVSLLLGYEDGKNAKAGVATDVKITEKDKIDTADDPKHRRRYSKMPNLVSDVRLTTPGLSQSTPSVRLVGNSVEATISETISEKPEEHILFVVDVTAPQFNFEGKNDTGRVLVAATSGTIVGKRFGDPMTNQSQTVSISLSKAQAHVAPLDVDVYAGVQWLDEKTVLRGTTDTGIDESNQDELHADTADGTQHTMKHKHGPHSSGYLLRRIFEPCSMDLAFITKEPGAKGSDENSESENTSSSKKSERPPEALTEFRLHSPEIEAELDAEQFSALVDVVGSVFLSQLGDVKVKPSVEASHLLANENRSLIDAEDKESAAVVAGPMAEHQIATWQVVSSEMDVHTMRAWSDVLASSTTNSTLNLTPSPDSLNSLTLGLRHQLIDSENAVGGAITEAETLVKQNRRRPAIALSLSIDHFRWAMRAGGRSFLIARVEGLKLQRERHSDTSGTTSLRLQDLKLDVPAAKSVFDASKRTRVFTKSVFGRWDPDAGDGGLQGFKSTTGGFTVTHSFGKGKGVVSGDGEMTTNSSVISNKSATPLVLINAQRAASPPEAPVWDLIEVTIEPFDLHLESETYGTFIKYLFPEKRDSNSKMSDEMKRNHLAFEKGLEALRGKERSVGGLKGDSGGLLKGDIGDQSDTVTAERVRRDSFAESQSTSVDDERARALLLGSPLRKKHHRAKTWGADFFGGMGKQSGVPQATPKEFSTPVKPKRGRALSGPGGGTTLGERAPRPSKLNVGAKDGDGNPTGNPIDAAGQSSQPLEQHSPKVVVVRYLRVNSISLKVSYDGPPRSFHEVRLLLDQSTHSEFVGRWRELIDRIKKNIVWSVLKSVTGLQGKRLPGAEQSNRNVVTGITNTNRHSRGNSKGIFISLDTNNVPDGFEQWEGDLDFAEGLEQLGSPTAAAMVAESDGLVVPDVSLGKSVWRSVFGNRKGSTWTAASSEHGNKRVKDTASTPEGQTGTLYCRPGGNQKNKLQ